MLSASAGYVTQTQQTHTHDMICCATNSSGLAMLNT